MAGNYYFEQWKRVLKNLESVISIDIDNQKNKAHDKDICDASLRLSGVLGSYVCCYNATFDCLQQNLQVQKTAYMENVVKALLTRILELKEQLRKLERTCYEYLSEGLIEYKLTPYDVELENIYFKNHRPRDIQRLVDDALREAKAVAHKDLMAEEVEESVGFEEEDRWWETDNEQVETKSKGINVGAIYAVEKKMSQETLKRKQLLSLIQAHEKSRQTIQEYTLRNERRLLWEKELKGTLNPPARVELRERASLLIQTIIRKYFHLKRKKVTDCKLDQLLGINYCKQIKDLRDVKEEENKIKSKTCELKKMYNNKWKLEYKELKTKFIKKKEGDIADDFREFIRCWFKTWFEEVQFFHAIPKENQGGITRIIKNEISSPAEWLDEYNAYLEQKKATKHKTATQLKYEKLEAKREEMEFKREAMKKKKLQIELMRKLMKNPNIHPGYQYPESKKIEHLIEAVAVYKNKWSEWDDLNIVKVKKGHIREVDFEEICATVKEEICNSVENDMRNRIIPPALDVQSLAYVLQGYAIGQLIKQLDNFLTAERIVQIATQGLSPTEVYDHFLQNDEAKVDYERYHKWNSEKTHWGKVEKKHLEEQLEFRQNIERWKEKIEKQKKKQ
ncbi:unnamed protein product [Leptosia nina]|uniref:Uncharacterized protein n=1 Tax=Leptosia nina TaxID=320188 RepID=A0AAV1JCH4_9NEOP